MLAPGQKGTWPGYCNWTIRVLCLLGAVWGVLGGDTDGSRNGVGNGGEGVSQAVLQAQAQPQAPVQAQTGFVCLVRDKGVIEWPVCVEEGGSSTTAAAMAATTTSTSASTSASASAASETGTETHFTNTATQDHDLDLDTDSPLDNSHFLSFEDWKKQNLAKVGQSAENVGGSRRVGAAAGKEPRGRPTGINNALDSLGDDSEIELDFPGFGTGSTDSARPMDWDHTASGAASVTAELRTDGAYGSGVGGGDSDGGTERDVVNDGDSISHEVIRTGPSRRRDAGTTCKERFNYASFDCAATVLKTNSECTGSSSVLIENKDSYMLNECRANNKFLILELCDDILVDTVVLANYEFFSSIFHTFRVSVSDRYPAKPDQWKELGVYEARNTREVQAFAVENPLIWARYLKIEFLTHYGHEFYCPLSLIRVHGTTMMEEYKHDGEVGRVDEEIVDLALESATEVDIKPISVDSSAAGIKTEVSDGGGGGGTASREAWFHRGKEIETLLLKGPFHSHADTCGTDASSADTDWFGEVAEPTDSAVPAGSQITSVVVGETVTGSDMLSKESAVADTRVSNAAATTTAVNETLQQQQQQQQQQQNQNVTFEADVKEDATSDPVKSTTTAATTTTTTQPPSSNPTTQESFFKSVNKRLQMLETNSTLSLLYIEEQSRILRDAFNKVEKRQLGKTGTFLEQLNQTVLDELKQFREQYDQVWKTVVFEFEHQRLSHHREMYSLSGQLGILADELVFQKRVAVVQSIMVVVCFGLILFSTSGVVSSRSSGGGCLDFNMVSSRRSYSLRSSSPRTFGSPTASSASASPSSTRPASLYRTHSGERGDEDGHGHGHRRDLSDDSQGPAIAYSPPTPTSNRSDDDSREGAGASGDGLAMPLDSHIRSRSSPPVLNGEAI